MRAPTWALLPPLADSQSTPHSNQRGPSRVRSCHSRGMRNSRPDLTVALRPYVTLPSSPRLSSAPALSLTLAAQLPHVLTKGLSLALPSA